MQPLRLVFAIVLAGLAACEALYDDTGSAEPSSPWPWVCTDGGPASDSGCLGGAATEDGSPDGQAADAGAAPDP